LMVQCDPQLGLQAIILGTFIGLILGIVAALRNNTWVDYGATIISVLGMSVPSFVFAALLQYFVGVKLGWFNAIHNHICYWTVIILE
ncbi:ABC transporter permease subunit, partial [Bacillus sp. D-CC]